VHFATEIFHRSMPCGNTQRQSTPITEFQEPQGASSLKSAKWSPFPEQEVVGSKRMIIKGEKASESLFANLARVFGSQLTPSAKNMAKNAKAAISEHFHTSCGNQVRTE
jgi:hypothetical protein